MPSNDVAYAYALNVLKAPVRDEGKKYSCGLTATIYGQFVCIETPLLNESYECAEVHHVHFQSGLQLSEVNIPQT